MSFTPVSVIDETMQHVSKLKKTSRYRHAYRYKTTAELNKTRRVLEIIERGITSTLTFCLYKTYTERPADSGNAEQDFYRRYSAALMVIESLEDIKHPAITYAVKVLHSELLWRRNLEALPPITTRRIDTPISPLM